VIDEQYSKKANNRSGGVGTETQIISSEVYESVKQNKFVAVIANRDQAGKAKLPVFYKSRIYIDLSDEDLYLKNFEQLLRWIYDKPLNVKPEIGNKPRFLDEETSVSPGTSLALRRCIEAIKNSRPHSQGALVEYFSLFSSNLSRFRLSPSKGANDFDQKVVDNVEQFIPFRNELIEVFATLSQYDIINSSASAIHKFFESLIPYLNRPTDVKSYHEIDWDNFKFIVQECFLICIAICLKYERYKIVEHLLKHRYFIEDYDGNGRDKILSYAVFNNRLATLTHRNKRLKLNRLSVHADMMKERCTDSGISFNLIMQADFLLYLVDALQSLKEDRRQKWWPETLVFKSFHGGTFEIFLRSESSEYFNRLAPVLGVESKSDLDHLPDALIKNTIYIPKWDFDGSYFLLSIF